MAKEQKYAENGRLKGAERLRQAILNFLNANPASNSRSICSHLCGIGMELSNQRVTQALGRMESLLEIRRESIEGGGGGKPSYLWHALCERTVTAEEMGEIIGQNANRKAEHRSMAEKRAAEGRDKKRPQTGPNGGRVHYSGDIPEIARYHDKGGQGALVRPAMGSGMYAVGDW